MADPPDGEPDPLPGGAQETVVVTAQHGTPPPSEFRRLTRAYKRQRNDNTTFTGTKETPRFEFSGGGEGRGTKLDELAWLIANLKETIAQQTSIIEKQSGTIEHLRTDLADIKEEQQTLNRQNAELQEQVCSLQAQISDCAVLPGSTRSWASVAANRSGTGATQQTPNDTVPIDGSLRRHHPFPSVTTDTLYCVIDTSRVTEEDTDKTSPGAIRAAVEKEMRTNDGKDSWRCRAVTRDARNTSRIKIACRDESERDMVKQAAETKIAPGIRVLRDELYPIKVDNVNRLAVLDENGDIRTGAADAFGQENETTVAKVAWLSKRDVAKAYGSMVVYLTKVDDARRLLREGFFHVAGESGYTGIFERRPRPEQCFNCQQLGHKAFQCKNGQKCARCAAEGHRHSECTATVVKCVPCGGPHESFSRNCRKLYPSHHE